MVSFQELHEADFAGVTETAEAWANMAKALDGLDGRVGRDLTNTPQRAGWQEGRRTTRAGPSRPSTRTSPRPRVSPGPSRRSSRTPPRTSPPPAGTSTRRSTTRPNRSSPSPPTGRSAGRRCPPKVATTPTTRRSSASTRRT
ncbi:hypothetical protein ACFQ0M_14220 [Kitasatospora aburaviensis]